MGALFSIAVLLASCSSSEPAAPPRADPPAEPEARPTVELTGQRLPPRAVDDSQTRFVAGSVRVESRDGAWIVARDLFTGPIHVAMPIEGGWLFMAEPGLIARSATFTGELEVLGSLVSDAAPRAIPEIGLLDVVARLPSVPHRRLRTPDARDCPRALCGLAKIAGLDARPDGTLVGPMALADGSTARATCRPAP